MSRGREPNFLVVDVVQGAEIGQQGYFSHVFELINVVLRLLKKLLKLFFGYNFLVVIDVAHFAEELDEP